MVVAKPRTRFLPTLTQVVTAEELLDGHDTVPGPKLFSDTMVDDDAFFRQVVNTVMPIVEARLKEEMQFFMEERFHDLSASLRREVELAVLTTLASRDTDSSAGT